MAPQGHGYPPNPAGNRRPFSRSLHPPMSQTGVRGVGVPLVGGPHWISGELILEKGIKFMDRFSRRYAKAVPPRYYLATQEDVKYVFDNLDDFKTFDAKYAADEMGTKALLRAISSMHDNRKLARKRLEAVLDRMVDEGKLFRRIVIVGISSPFPVYNNKVQRDDEVIPYLFDEWNAYIPSMHDVLYVLRQEPDVEFYRTAIAAKIRELRKEKCVHGIALYNLVTNMVTAGKLEAINDGRYNRYRERK